MNLTPSPTTLEEHRDYLDFYHRRLAAAKKSHDPDPHYCSVCFSSQEPSLSQRASTCCQATVINRALTITALEQLIITVADEIKRLINTEHPAAPKLEKTAAADEGGPLSGEIIVVIGQEPHKFPTAKKARHWLRDHNLSVRDARKEGHAADTGETWYFEA